MSIASKAVEIGSRPVGAGRETCRFLPRRTLLTLLFAIAFLPAVFSSAAQAKYASLVLDADTGQVLHSVNADTRNYPASLTKMMTLYLVFEALERGDIAMNTAWTASARVAGQPASRLGLARGEKITVRDAVLALITKSANDVATLVGESLAGSERDFALKMTAKAREIGMARTTFRNASGLGNRGQLSTARDMAILALALIRDFPQYYELFSTTRYKHGDRTYKNHNKLLTAYEGTDGIKTGYISASGFNLVASVKRGNKRLIGVVFGGKSSKQRNRHMIKLLDKGWRILAEQGTVMADAGPVPQAPAKPATETAAVQPANGKSGWGIQVGAFADRAHAKRVATDAASLVPELLEEGHVTVVPLIQKSGKQLYRSRIHGITKAQAYQACKALERRKRQCMELRVPSSLEVADAGQ
ncbi:MAG: D-alanyl-D-alanine carboxypeptidase [Rhodospirillales bacterium]